MSRSQAIRWGAVIGCFLICCGPTRRCGAADVAVTPENIDRAIKRGREYLLKLQHPGGRWETEPARLSDEHGSGESSGDSFGGYTALATYALLASGSSVQDPPIDSAITFLKHADVIGAYSLGLRAQVWLYLPDGAERKSLAQRDAQLLLKGLNKSGIPGSIGLWDYIDHSDVGKAIDHSASQYGVLGLWACAQSRAKIDADKWKIMEQAWRGNQGSDGGWSYNGTKDRTPSTISMTAAGIASLYITEDYVLNDAGVKCAGNFNNRPIDDALRWLGEHFRGGDPNHYALYGVERIGMAAGLKYVGGKDWYALGAGSLLSAQGDDGSWSSGGFPGSDGVTSTSYSLLFLARGRTPVAFNKVQYGAAVGESRASTWNQRPRDAANLVRWLGWKTERDLRWQVVDLAGPEEDLHDAPVLYISGGGSFDLSEPEMEKLRHYSQAGGTIFANANCKKEIFDRSFRAVMKRAFPDREMRVLSAEHVLFSKQMFPGRKWKDLPVVEGISNGVRELVVYASQSDPAKSWQIRNDPFVGLGEEDFQFGADVFSYATDRGVTLPRGKSWIVKDAGVKPMKSIRVARLQAGSNPDPEPGAWPRLASILKNESYLGIQCDLVEPAAAKLAGATVAHLTGTGEFALTADQRNALKGFVDHGGTLVVDAAGGNTAFARSAESELTATFGADAAASLKNPLPPEHPVYVMTSQKIEKVAYRQYARETLVGGLKTPRLAGLAMPDGRIGVFFSREDLTAGMVGQPVYGILGYEPGFATAIMRNIVIYAATGGKGDRVLKPADPKAIPF